VNHKICVRICQVLLKSDYNIPVSAYLIVYKVLTYYRIFFLR